MEGYLEKWTNYVFGWQRRYFILSNGILKYSKQKGLPIRGVIHLDVSQIIKHKNNKRFYIDTGLTLMHLKAGDPQEAKSWFEQLQANKEISVGYSQKNDIINMISEKVAQINSIHAQILSEADLLPLNLLKTTPGLERAIALCENMKDISSTTLGYIETQEEYLMQPIDVENFIRKSQCKPGEDSSLDDSSIFVDARSQPSEI